MAERHFFGTSWNYTKPIVPPRHEFVYSADQLCTAGSPLLALQEPPPAVPFPADATYPQAPTYVLVKDNRYERGYVYAASFKVENIETHRNLLMSVVEPPNTAPRLIDGVYVADPIPGMVQMVPGVPYIYHIDGDENRIQTIGCAHTLESLRHYPDFSEILEASVRLAKLSWGCPAHGNTPIIPPLYSHPLKHNDRSGGADSNTCDGSFSLANTIIKGEGQGSVAPAIQVNTPLGAAQISAVLSVLHKICRHIIPKSLSKFEQVMWEFHCQDENVVTFGGLEPGHTSCQFNVSSLGDHLTKHMGPRQGRNHTDHGDDIDFYTVFVLYIRAGPSQFCSLLWHAITY